MSGPNGRERTISFGEWCRSPNAFRWVRPHCGTALKANRATWAWLPGALLLLIPILSGIIVLESSSYLPRGLGKLMLLAAVIVVIVPFSYVAYRHGGSEQR